MPFTNYTNLDFDQIKTSIKDYLRSNSNFTDYDFEGSNFSVLIDTLAYNTYINAFNSNLAVNEVFLDSATIRENVVSLARNIGYVPKSKKAATAIVSFDLEIQQSSLDDPITSIILQPELICVGSSNNSSYIFSITEEISQTVNSSNVASFSNIQIYQGRYLNKIFTVDGSLDQRFILQNPYIDTSTIRVYVRNIDSVGTGKKYNLVDNITTVDSESEIYLIQEVKDEKYELLFGDGVFGKKLENGSEIVVHYIVTDGSEGNGVSEFSFSGSYQGKKSSQNIISIQATNAINVQTVQPSRNGSDIESIDSIRYYAPRIYSSQYRAVTARDYESIIKTNIYPNADVVNVIGGEELDPPEYGSVTIAIKPKNGLIISDFDKKNILSELKQYSITGINQKIVDIKVLYIELDSSIYYDTTKSSTPLAIKSKVQNSLTTFGNSLYSSKRGGRFKYSKAINLIDESDTAITSNITRVIIRRNLNCLINQFSEYELCFGNRFYVNPEGGNIKSTGFRVNSRVANNEFVYFTDIPNSDKLKGTIAVIKPSSTPGISPIVILKSAGTVDYVTGEIKISAINIISTEVPNNIIEIQAFPESNDIIGLKDLYLSLSTSKTKINIIKDVISSGENTTGVLFSTSDYYKSSYSNGSIIRN
jgi:hypothetical protein